MRTYDIPYVKNAGTGSYMAPAKLEDLDLRTIVKTYLCGKSQGKISECMKCKAQCAYGKRALELAFPELNHAFAPAPLIDGKTIIEHAKEEAAQKRAQAAEAKTEAKPAEKKKSKRTIIENWYDKAYESGDPLKWIMDAFNINERKAKQKVYEYQYRHPEVKEAKPMWGKKTKAEPETKPVETKPVATQPAEAKPAEPVAQKEEIKEETKVEKDDSLLAPLEEKINFLMNLQAEYKDKYEHYQKLYQATKTKVDALYEALNILNE